MKTKKVFNWLIAIAEVLVCPPSWNAIMINTLKKSNNTKSNMTILSALQTTGGIKKSKPGLFLILLGALMMLNLPIVSAGASNNLIDATHGIGAGSFELGAYVDNSSSFMPVLPGDNNTIKGWTVSGPGDGIDWLIAPHFRVDTGIHAVDLEHLTNSSIATVIPTVSGQMYELSFTAAAVYASSEVLGDNEGMVSAGSLVNQPFAAEFSSAPSSQTYKPFKFLFTAIDSETTIQFTATGGNTAYGPVIDSISVREVSSIAIDTLEDIGADGTEVTSRVINGVTVSISHSGTSVMGARTYNDSLPAAFAGKNGAINAPLNPENVSGSRFISTGINTIDNVSPIIFDFSTPIQGFGLTTLDLLENVAAGNMFVTLEALDANDQVIASQTRYGPLGPSGLDLDWYVSSSSPEITRVILSSNIGHNYGAGYGIDDLLVEVSPVSEWFGESLSIESSYVYTLEQGAQISDVIQILNPGDETRAATLTVLNPHSGLTITLPSTYPVTIEPGETVSLPIQVDATSVPVGTYEGILLEVAIDDGSTLYANMTVQVTEQGKADLPDLAISATDIGFTSSGSSEPVTLTANIYNNGNTAAADVAVRFYEFGTLLGETEITEIPADGNINTSITVPMETSGDHLIEVVIDPEGIIEELDTSNNRASQVIQPGGPSVITDGNIQVTGSRPKSICAGSLFYVSGKALYVINGYNTNYVVKGGSVQVTVAGDGKEWVYGNLHTDINGNFRTYLQAPATLETTVTVTTTVTDHTFRGTNIFEFEVSECPVGPRLPPNPPGLPTPDEGGSGSGNGSGSSCWEQINEKEVWVCPTSLPMQDVFVYSENIHFSINSPDLNQEMTIFSEIRYWAQSTDLIAEQVPVNIYVTQFGSTTETIFQGKISSLSVGSPDYGSRYVFATWKPPADGIYLVEVEIDPSYVESNMLNNAATRAIIAGEFDSEWGVISGQVTNVFGGVDNIIISLMDNNGALGSTFTDSTGFYLFDAVNLGEKQVHIDAPDGYVPDAQTKSTEVFDQEVSNVDFYLTQQQAPIADANGPYSGTVGSAVTLNASGSYDTDGHIVSYEWDYDNDGIYDYSTASPTTEYTWDTEFNGSIAVRVTDNDGLVAIDTASVVITASVQALCGDLDADNDVDIDDRNILISALNSNTGDARFIPAADYDADGLISYNDYREWYACYKAFIMP